MEAFKNINLPKELVQGTKNAQMHKSSGSGITRNSTDLTRSNNLVEQNPAEIVGKIFDRFRLAQGWKLTDDDTEHDLRVTVWLEILGTAKIQPRFYERLYQKAMVTRGRRKGQGQDVPFFITPEELIAEYDGLLKELAEKPSEPKECSVPHDDEDDRLVEYMLWGETPAMLPCHECRPEAHRQRKSARIEEKRNKTLRLNAKPENTEKI